MQFLVVLEKFTCAYLFQIALEIIRLPILIALLRANQIARITSDFKMDVIKGVIGRVISNRPRATRSADLKLRARLLLNSTTRRPITN